MKKPFLLLATTLLPLVFSGPVIAKKPGNYEYDPPARGDNSNKQSVPRSTRGRDRAEQKYEQKQYSKHKEKREKFKDNHSRYENMNKSRDRSENRGRHDDFQQQSERHRDQYEQRNYQNPVDTIIDRNVNDLKSGVDGLHRRAIENIDNKAREFSEPR